MKTIQKNPWNVKIGDKIGPFQSFANGPTEFRKVKDISREIGHFTGSKMWTFECENMDIPITYHGKTNNLPAQKVNVLVK